MNAIEKLNALSAGETGLWNALEEKQADWVAHAENIALRILEWLSSNKMSQKELAEKMGVTPQYISRVVNAKENLTLEAISKIEKALSTKILEIKASEPTPVTKYFISTNVSFEKRASFTVNVEDKDKFSLLHLKAGKQADNNYKKLA